MAHLSGEGGIAVGEIKGPAELVLTASVARRYYLDGLSKVEIGQEFTLSRFKVARLLEVARTSGMVRIEIGYPGLIDVDLSSRLQEAFSLQHVVVVATPEQHPQTLYRDLGSAAADLLAEITTADDVLGLAWARSVTAMAAAMTSLAPCTVVQLTGALSRPDVNESSIELVREVARIGGGPAYYFYAPLIVPDAATARTLRQQPEVARAMDRFRSVTLAVAGIGAWAPGLSTVFDAVSPAEQRRLRELGVRADISGIVVDAEGTPVPADLSDRMIGVTADEMVAIPKVIGIAHGTAKVDAVRAAVRGKLVSGLVTHSALAQALLDAT